MNVKDHEKKSELKIIDPVNQNLVSFEFLAHDINNIFNNVRGSTELCRIFLDGSNQISKIHDQLNLISGQIARGIKLISNARILSQDNKLKSSLKQIDIIGELKRAIMFVEKNFRDKKLSIKINQFDKTIKVDANEFIVNVFENILINAVLHNLNNSVDVTVQITQTLKENQNYIKFEFIDNGIGISDERKERIFKSSFVKDKHGKGMGFGLTLVKEIIDSYGGFIWVENRIKGDYSKGSNFIILIPVGSNK
ncbi:MAG: HAMP domain-containing histidine kinase [Candidatus Lokiarchaeota archaeon]|nr:HAMP domain-containing histidine kinase [Candidatus Lokiarchaeota archaeon]